MRGQNRRTLAVLRLNGITSKRSKRWAVCRSVQTFLSNTCNKILRKYPESTMARELSKELASFSGDPSNLVISGTYNSTMFCMLGYSFGTPILARQLEPQLRSQNHRLQATPRKSRK